MTVNENLIAMTYPEFKEAFWRQVSGSRADETHGYLLRVLLYFVWRMLTLTHVSVKHTPSVPELELLCLSTYKALIPLMQLIRLGYSGAALVVQRAVMEQINTLGYLQANPEALPRFTNGKDLNKKPFEWAKEFLFPDNSEQRQGWVRLYSEISKIAHIYLAGAAAPLMDNTAIGAAYRGGVFSEGLELDAKTTWLAELVCFDLTALDPIALKVLGATELSPFPADYAGAANYLPAEDVAWFVTFFMRHDIVRAGKAWSRQQEAERKSADS